MTTAENERFIDALEAWVHDAETGAPSIDRLAAELDAASSLHNVWLALAVLGRGLATEAEVRAGRRMVVNRGAETLLRGFVPAFLRAARQGHLVDLRRSPIIVDVRHTAETDLSTGIQRVARETVKRWRQSQDITLVTWTADGTAMRSLLPEELSTAIDAVPPVHGSTRAADKRIIVPVGGTYILPELAAETWRTERVAAMAAFGNLRSGIIGFDCVPLTTAETVGDGMPGAFARNLVAVANMDRVGAISDAAATEYRGWRRMLSASGIAGPDVTSVLLAAEPGISSAADEAEFAALAGLGDDPLVLVVGSHEPRKNHLAVLQAAELAWREGLSFHLLFVGGNSWNSLDFTDLLEVLRAQGRHVDAISALPDRLLWAAYKMSRFTVFTSINEGFGLPVAESLASGTPVLTSQYGSMRQIASGGGTVVVDPRDDDDILRGFRSLLTDDALYARLKSEAAAYVVRPWDDYAKELWNYFVEA